MTDRNTNKLILTACCLFAGWLAVHLDVLDMANNLTGGLFYITPIGTQRKLDAEYESEARRMDKWYFDDDMKKCEKDDITVDEVLRRKQVRVEIEHLAALLRKP